MAKAKGSSLGFTLGRNAEANTQGPQLSASELYCPTCRKPQAVRERLLLILPDGELYEYQCSVCRTPVGERRTRDVRPVRLYVPR